MIKYNATTQKKLEDIFDEGGYTVRYEKGSFNSGFCILEKRRVVVINKFHPQDAKINSLIEILGIVDLNMEGLSAESLRLFNSYQEVKVEPLFN